MKKALCFTLAAVVVLCAAVAAQSPPETPTGTLDTDGIVTMAWPPNPEPDIAYYEVWRVEQVGKAFVPKYTDYSARCGGDYIYMVKAVDGVGGVSGYSPMSAVVQVRITNLPPTLSVTENEDGSVRLSVE